MRKGDVHLRVEAPEGEQIIRPGPEARTQSLADLLRKAGLPLNTRCGQKGVCDGCMVELVTGCLTHRSGKATVTANGQAIQVRGCEHHLCDSSSAVVRIPPRSLLAHEPQVVSNFRINVPWAHDPLAGNLGVAIDIGTTTVALLLVDMASGDVIATSSSFNRQMHLGDDVLTRINLCSTDASMLAELHEALTKRTIMPLLEHALEEAPLSMSNGAELRRLIDQRKINCITVAANTTMLHLLAKVDPSSMGIAPFTPAFLDHQVYEAGTLGLDLAPRAQVHLLPGAAAYVGADIVTGVLASGLAYDDGPSLLVDVGTNGEIVLMHGDRMLGCATAAGPAFEGAKLTSGIRAGAGAISRIRIEPDPLTIHTEVIGGGKPIGICGSAYIDFLTQGLNAGVLTPTGRFEQQMVDANPRLFSKEDDVGRSLRIARAPGSQPILISERDIASLLQAKAAIAAGILTLLRREHLSPSDLKKVYVAGGFGLHLDQPSAIGCGLLPGFNVDQIHVVGNTSLAGAYLSLVDRNIMGELDRIAREIDIVELNLDPEFESCYIEQLSLPDKTEHP